VTGERAGSGPRKSSGEGQPSRSSVAHGAHSGPKAVVDVHAHVLAQDLVRAPCKEEPWRPAVGRREGRQVVELGGRPVDSLVGELVDIDGILRESARAGVDHVLLSPWVALLPDGLDPGLAGEVCGAQNESLARAVQAGRGSVSALGAVTLSRPDRAVAQLEEIMAAGLAGVEVTASVGGTYLGDDRFLPFYEAAEELGALIFVHPATRGLSLPVSGEYYLWNGLVNPVETALAAAHLVLSGVVERYSNLRLLLAHGGGVLPAIWGRLDRAHEVRPEARTRLRQPPRQSCRRLFFDTLTHDRALLLSLVQEVGPHHVLMGSDRPFDMGSPHPVEDVLALGLPAEAEAQVLGASAARLVGLAGEAEEGGWLAGQGGTPGPWSGAGR
jgi:aminocarboxymuconate-semialdehyde decarboxylase